MTLRKYTDNTNDILPARVGPADGKSAGKTHVHTSMKDLPEAERPREKLFINGPASPSNAELLAILLGSGTRSQSAVSLAERVLAADGSGILFLNDCTPEELCSIEGIGPAKSAALIASAELGRRLTTTPREKQANVSSPDDISKLFMQNMRYLKKECFKVLLLNVKNEIISIEDVSVGSLMSSDAHPREVFAAPLRRGAANVILVPQSSERQLKAQPGRHRPDSEAVVGRRYNGDTRAGPHYNRRRGVHEHEEGASVLMILRVGDREVPII